MSAEKVAAALQAEIERSLAADPALPGILATVQAPCIGLDWSGAAGVLRFGGAELLTPAHAFRIASVTKPYTSAVALRLFEQDRLALFEPITPWLDGHTLGALRAGGYAPETITLWHLLTHGSGLRDHASAAPYAQAVLGEPSHVWRHAEQVDFCMSLGAPLSRPGTHFSYSDTGYLILGDILERVADRPLHALMRELLNFEGLGLRDTHFERHEPAPAGQLRATQYFAQVDVATVDCSADLSGGGGLISTTGELCSFFRAAVLGELFERPATRVLALTTPSLIFTPPMQTLHSPLLRGLILGREPGWGHGGFWGVGAGYCPASDISVAWSVQQVQAGESTTGVPGDPARPGLGARLALIAQEAVGAVHP